MASMVDEMRRQDMLKRAGVEMYAPQPLLGAATKPAAPKPAAPQASGPSLIQRAFPNTVGAMDDRRSLIDEAQKTGGTGAAVGQSLRTAMMPAIGLADDTATGLAKFLNPAAQAAKTFATGDATPISNPLVQAASPAAPAAPRPQPAYSNEGRSALPASDSPQVKKAMPAPDVAASNPLVKQIAPGVFRQGNSYGDSAESAASFANNKPVSAQNMAAADQLATRYQSNPLIQAATQQPANQNLTPADTGQGTGYGLLNSNRIAARNAMMDVQQAKPGSGTALKSLLQQQADAPAQQLARDRLAQDGQNSAADRLVRSNELVARAGESAADRALRSQELADSMKTNAVKRDAAGVELTAAQRLQALQGEYLSAETDAARESAAKKLQGLQGKAPSDEYMAVASGQTVDSMGNITKAPDLIVNKRTGQPVNVGQGAKPAQGPTQITNDAAGQAAFAALPSGAVFIGPDGKQHRKD